MPGFVDPHVEAVGTPVSGVDGLYDLTGLADELRAL
jgi:hypothetical protein